MHYGQWSTCSAAGQLLAAIEGIAEIVLPARIIKRSRVQKDEIFQHYYDTVKADETSMLLTEAKRQTAINK